MEKFKVEDSAFYCGELVGNAFTSLYDEEDNTSNKGDLKHCTASQSRCMLSVKPVIPVYLQGVLIPA
jgi:hypothetical protein